MAKLTEAVRLWFVPTEAGLDEMETPTTDSLREYTDCSFHSSEADAFETAEAFTENTGLDVPIFTGLLPAGTDLIEVLLAACNEEEFLHTRLSDVARVNLCTFDNEEDD